MQILEYPQGFCPLQLIERGREHLIPAGAVRDGGQQGTLRLACDVVEWCQWPRREQRVARPPQDPRVGQLPDEFLQQGRLADAGLTAHEYHAATEFPRRVEPFSQIGE